MPEPQVTIVVVPRERFSCTEESLESLYRYTELPFQLVYVDGNSPAAVRRYLEAQAKAKNFQLVRTNYYLSPNHARNLGLGYVKTKYLVFVDNDVIVSPGWLKALVTCAEETEASVVGPLMCHNKPVHEEVHFAGGECRIVTDIHGRRHLREKMYKQGHKVAALRPQLQRKPVELAEFHCLLIRTEIFRKTGALDENMLCTKEHLDFCLSVAQSGGSIYFEPDSLVTYVPGPPLQWTDLHYYMLRWSDRWTLDSLTHLQKKWDLAEDGYFKSRYQSLGGRRLYSIIKPLSRKLSFGFYNKPLVKILSLVDKAFNYYLTERYARTQPQPSQGRIRENSSEQQLTSLSKS